MAEMNTGREDMEELTMIRAALVEPPPPDPGVIAAARQRLVAQTGAPATRPPLPGAPGSAGLRLLRAPRRRWAVAVTGIAAAGLAGALAVTTLLPPGASGPGRSGHGGGGGLIVSEDRPLGAVNAHAARTFLLATASRLAQTTPTSGRYWCDLSRSAQLDAIGAGGRELTPKGQGLPASPVSDYRYSILDRQVANDCFDPSGLHNLGGYMRELGAAPATARDAAVWRREGSPAWHAWYGNGQLIPSRPGPRRSLGGKPGHEPWGSVANLPADPAKLRQVLLAAAGPSPAPAQALFSQARTLLLDPLPPTVRAADFRVLATIPGVRMQQDVRDPEGRAGTAIWLGSPYQFMSIVDPATGMLLADEFLIPRPGRVYAPGTVQQYVAWYTGWANRVPR